MKIVIYVYNGINMLDVIGLYEVFRKKNELFLVPETKGVIKADSNFVHLDIKHDINEVKSADILIVPGSSITFIREMKNKKVFIWMKKMSKTTEWTTSVCSGSLLLAAAGLLKGIKATSHWKIIKLLKKPAQFL